MHVKFGPHEITSVIFLIIFALLLPVSIYLWMKFIRAGYPWKYGFYGATLLCVCRVGCFISELVFYSSNYSNISAYIAYLVMLSIGYIGLIDCESALYLYWAERHFDISPAEQNITGKLRLLNLAGIVLIIVGSTKYDNRDNTASDRQLGQSLMRAALFIFLALTVFQAAYLAWGWVRHNKFSKTLMTLTVVMVALICRIVFSAVASFVQSVSVFNRSDSATKYLIGPFLIPEVVALVFMLGVGLSYVRSSNFGRQRLGGAPVAYDQEELKERNQQSGYV